MKQSDLNHLRRLVAWVRCEIGQSPEELVATMGGIAGLLGHPEISAGAKQRLVEQHDRARNVPRYVRGAIKALEKYVGQEAGVVDAEARPQEETCEIAQVRKLPGNGGKDDR